MGEDFEVDIIVRRHLEIRVRLQNSNIHVLNNVYPCWVCLIGNVKWDTAGAVLGGD